MKKVLIWTASILLVLAIGGAFAANYAVNKVIKSMSGMDLSGLVETTQDDSNNEGSSGSDNGSQSPTDASTKEGQAGNNSGETTSEGNEASGDSDSATNNDTKETEKPGYTAEVSVDKAKEIEENISLKDKAKVISTLMGSLSASDMATLQQLASGGLTVEKKKEAKKLLLEKLTEEQYNDLVAIAAKHGVSQGKKYNEVKDE